MPLTTAFRLSVLTTSLVLAACGGSGSSRYSDAAPTPPDQPNPTQPAEPLSATLTTGVTLMGGTFSVDGNVTVLTSTGGTLATVQQDRSGFSLYTFDVDSVDQSECVSDMCITTWPPLLANDTDTAEAPLSIIEREDGNKQWALRGFPLYFFKNDNAAGDVNGEGVGTVWNTAVTESTTLTHSDNDGVYLSAMGRIPVSSQVTDTQFDVVHSDGTGMTLYTFDLDSNGVSACNDACLDRWPALLADAGDRATAPYSIIERTLGTEGETARQWALNGLPLYLFAGDTAVGDVNGKTIPNWRLARPVNAATTDSDRGPYLAAAGLTRQAEPDNGVEVTQTLPLHGMALYTFDNDTDGSSTCTDDCLTRWPALMAHPGAEPSGLYSLVTRSTGEQQWALNGLPLYFFAGDNVPGDINGDEVSGVWHLARPVPVATATHESDGLMFTAHGQILDQDGQADTSREDFTLYTFDDDTASGLSTCYGGCATIWPPLYAPENAQDFGDFTVTRRDNPATDAVEDEFQWAYKGQPLYFVDSDTAPGDVTGVYGTWHLARP